MLRRCSCDETCSAAAQTVAVVAQTRWVFTNANSFLTWVQKINLNYHFEVEQRARSYLGWFFNFNGTGGMKSTVADTTQEV
jgi:hypothetical protein